MRKLLIFPVLGLAFFPLLTSAQGSDSPLCQDCLSSSTDYLVCLGGDYCYDVTESEDCYSSDDSCVISCSDAPLFCEEDYFEQRYSCAELCNALNEDDTIDESNECFVSCVPRYEDDYNECISTAQSQCNSCVSSCQVNNCGAGICLPSAGGEGGDSGNGGEGSSPIVGGVLDGTQLSNMGSSLINGGSSLLRIGIQLLPYAIVFTIILLIFTLIRNWSKLKTNKGLGDPYSTYYAGTGEKRNTSSHLNDIDLDVLNFYHDDYVKYNPGDDIYSDGKYYRAGNGKIAQDWYSKGKKHTSYYDDDTILSDILPDEEHHYKKRHGLYND